MKKHKVNKNLFLWKTLITFFFFILKSKQPPLHNGQDL